jgi:hypothetical protein
MLAAHVRLGDNVAAAAAFDRSEEERRRRESLETETELEEGKGKGAFAGTAKKKKPQRKHPKIRRLGQEKLDMLAPTALLDAVGLYKLNSI